MINKEFAQILKFLLQPKVEITEQQVRKTLSHQEREIQNLTVQPYSRSSLLYKRLVINSEIELNSNEFSVNEKKLKEYFDPMLLQLKKLINNMDDKSIQLIKDELSKTVAQINTSAHKQINRIQELGYEAVIPLLPSFDYGGLTGVKFWDFAFHMKGYTKKVRELLSELIKYTPKRSVKSGNWRNHSENAEKNLETLKKLVPKYFSSTEELKKFYSLLNTNNTTDYVTFNGLHTEFKLITETLKNHPSFKISQIHKYFGNKVQIAHQRSSIKLKLWKDCNPRKVQATNRTYLKKIIDNLV